MARYEIPKDPNEVIGIDPNGREMRRGGEASAEGRYVPSGMRRIQSLQHDVGNRLTGLREQRQGMTDVAAQPHLQQLSEQAGMQGRTVGLEGSLGEQRRSEIGMDKELAKQQIKSQAFEQQLTSEAGLQSLENDFTNTYNAMNQEDFVRELSGLGEEMDRFMASEGRRIQYEELASRARKSSNAMYGRFANALGTAYQRGQRDDGSDSRGVPKIGAGNYDMTPTDAFGRRR